MNGTAAMVLAVAALVIVFAVAIGVAAEVYDRRRTAGKATRQRAARELGRDPSAPEPCGDPNLLAAWREIETIAPSDPSER